MTKKLPDTFSKNRPRKGLVRDRIYSPPPIGPYRQVLLLPGAEMLDLQMGFINGCFDKLTSFVLVESDIKIAEAIDEYYRNYPGEYELIIDRLETIQPGDFADRKFDFVNLDTCNAYTQELHDWIRSVLAPSLAEDCVIWLTLTDRYMPGSLWGTKGKGTTDLSARDWTRDQLLSALPNMVSASEFVYTDSCRMWVTGFVRGLFAQLHETGEIPMNEMTEKQQLVYQMLPTAGKKAHYRRQLGSSANAHEKQQVTLRYLRELGCKNYFELEDRVKQKRREHGLPS